MYKRQETDNDRIKGFEDAIKDEPDMELSLIHILDPSADAANSESAGKDFRFVNNTDAPIYIEGYTTEAVSYTHLH